MSNKLQFNKYSIHAAILSHVYGEFYHTNFMDLYKQMDHKFTPLRKAYKELKSLGMFQKQTMGPLKGLTHLSELGTTVMYRTFGCLEEGE